MSRDSDENEEGGAGLHPLHVPALVGHRDAQRSLLSAYTSGRLHHAWLIGGPPGIGKATLAWHFARLLLAFPDPTDPRIADATDLSVAAGAPVTQRILAGGHGDVFVLERQWNDKTKKLFSEIRVDDVRHALGMFRQAAGSGGYRICIIDSAEDLNRSSANALLKMIEEPPPRSVFLIVAHNPGQVMPTLVSRCRRLILSALTDTEVGQAVGLFGGAGSGTDASRVQDAAGRARGSVGEAIRLLAGRGLDLDTAVQGCLADLPTIDFGRVHRLADAIGFSDESLDLALRAIFDWLDHRVQDRAGHVDPRTLMAFADAWDSIRRAAREATVLNLDKRSLLLSIFADLARTARTA